MADYLDVLASSALESIREGYYDPILETRDEPRSLKESILGCRKAPVISEIKFSSPSSGTLREKGDVVDMAREMEEGGAVGLSILTEAKRFKGRLGYVAEIRRGTGVPILMKDIVLDRVQVDAASGRGASAILLIQAVFERGYCGERVQDMIEYAHSRNLEVLLESHTGDEFASALETEADLIGINNRNLKTLEVDLDVTRRILDRSRFGDRVIVSESGIGSAEDIRFLHKCGARAFLVGTSVMKSSNIREKVRELVNAL